MVETDGKTLGRVPWLCGRLPPQGPPACSPHHLRTPRPALSLLQCPEYKVRTSVVPHTPEHLTWLGAGQRVPGWAQGLPLAEALSGEGRSVALCLSTALGRRLSCLGVQTWTPLGRKYETGTYLVSEDSRGLKPVGVAAGVQARAGAACCFQPAWVPPSLPAPTLKAPLPPPCCATPCS